MGPGRVEPMIGRTGEGWSSEEVFMSEEREEQGKRGGRDAEANGGGGRGMGRGTSRAGGLEISISIFISEGIGRVGMEEELRVVFVDATEKADEVKLEVEPELEGRET